MSSHKKKAEQKTASTTQFFQLSSTTVAPPFLQEWTFKRICSDIKISSTRWYLASLLPVWMLPQPLTPHPNPSPLNPTHAPQPLTPFLLYIWEKINIVTNEFIKLIDRSVTHLSIRWFLALFPLNIDFLSHSSPYPIYSTHISSPTPLLTPFIQLVSPLPLLSLPHLFNSYLLSHSSPLPFIQLIPLRSNNSAITSLTHFWHFFSTQVRFLKQ